MTTPGLTEPLIAAEVDLRDFQFMPLDVDRLRDSDFAARVKGDAFRAGLLLWCASWHQVPAGSLPNDDIVLAKLAGYGIVIDAWELVKVGAMYGWVLCSDGRYYHTVICEKAREAWHSKLEYAYGKECDRLRKDAKRRGIKDFHTPSFEEWDAQRVSGGKRAISGGRPADKNDGKPLSTAYPQGPSTAGHTSNGQRVTSNGQHDLSGGRDTMSAGNLCLSSGIPAENALKGQGQGELRDKNPPTPPTGGSHGAHAPSGRRARPIRAKSANAWERVREAARHGDATVNDELIDQAVREIGGYRRLGQANVSEAPTNRRRFREVYERLLEREVVAA